jgi:hypothetical protein
MANLRFIGNPHAEGLNRINVASDSQHMDLLKADTVFLDISATGFAGTAKARRRT